MYKCRLLYTIYIKLYCWYHGKYKLISDIFLKESVTVLYKLQGRGITAQLICTMKYGTSNLEIIFS